jgi:hypothetical protein
MAASPLGRLPAPRVPLLDERTGVMSREWYRFFLSQFQQVEIDSGLVVQDFTIDPPAYTAALTSAADEIGLAPPGLPIAPRYYGSFYDTTTQTAAAVNTAYAVTFNTTRDAFGVRRGSTTSQITFDNPGAYLIQFRMQVERANAGSDFLTVWAQHNGVSVPDSATIVQVHNNTAEIAAAWNFLLVVAAGDTFELMWAVDDVDIVLQASAAVAPAPAIPSVTLTAILVA